MTTAGVDVEVKAIVGDATADVVVALGTLGVTGKGDGAGVNVTAGATVAVGELAD